MLSPETPHESSAVVILDAVAVVILNAGTLWVKDLVPGVRDFSLRSK